MRIVALTPFEHADGRLARTLARQGCETLLDLGRDPVARRQALAAVDGVTLGVRVPEGVDVDLDALPASVTRVVLAAGPPVALTGREVWVEVRSVDEARAAVDAGAHGVVGVGHEAGGRGGAESAFVLAQRLVAAELGVPVWLRGGIGPHSAAACAVAGLDGVVADDALALVRESGLPRAIRDAVRAMDGSETTVIGGVRVLVRPDLPSAHLHADSPDDVLPRLGATDLHHDLIPVGQAAALAAPLAQQHPTAVAAIRAIAAAVDAHLDAARAADPLAEHAPLARAHGTRWPVVQGPMTRVSDRAAFAAAVADAGALPFVALSMLRGPAARDLLVETRDLLGDRPWGVGILGFVPAELREPQLAAILEIRPPVALIAGGRPSQARQLEQAGIATWLHAPSPALTRAFLTDGARRFVFEGRECGGHVGPRSSFVLWSQQVDALLAHPDLTDVEVLLAGGIHDARSAAMAMAIAGPLLARGAKVGVLMGTAYLFTSEAVATGAILADFQEVAVAARSTALLETAPGHATRCARTPFVDQFEAEKARLRAEGVDPKEAWATLEGLNVGRLRVAAKGVERAGDQLVEVDADRRRAEGMVMLGEVAALHDRVVSMAELHADVCTGGRALLGPEAGRIAPEPPAPPPCDVAIVGLAAILPDAPDVDTYWRHILDGHDAIREVPAERWRADLYYDPDGPAGRTTPSKWGGMLPETAFDPLAYGIPPRSLAAIDPAQLLALEVTARALRDADLETRPFDRSRTSVIFGTESGSDLGAAYSFRAHYAQFVGPLPDALDAALPSLTEDSFPGVLANVLAGRIANRLDLGGVNYTVDAACASSLAALDLAVKELVGGTSDVVVCGGADLHNGINDYLLFSSTHALSADGHCSTFDASADGIVLGEGVAAVVLKRLADAERDGDRIYAVVKGVGGSSDGRSLGLTAPRKEGQQQAVRRAWAMAGVDPATVGLVEAHGTGTVVGDRTELGTLSEVFDAPVGAVTLGSVKSQIGHTKCTAGLAGLIKVTLALHHGVRPPTSRIRTPNPAWQPDRSPFHFTSAPRPWARPDRVGAVSAFGFGGTNFHAVLVAHDPVPAAPRARRAELIALRGDDAQIDRTLDLLAARLTDPVPAPLGALAQAASARGAGPARLLLLAPDHAALAEILPAAKARTAVPHRVLLADPLPGEVALLFPGQGSQRPGMLRDLFVAFPELQRWLADDPALADLIHPPDAFDADARAAQAARLTDTRVAQPALGVVDLAVASWLDGLGLRPAMAAGHSYGEVAALTWAGALDPDALVATSRARAACILDAAPDDAGAMAAVTGTLADVAAAIDAHPELVVANHNAPRQVVIAGPTAAIDAVLPELDAAGLPARRIPVAAAFHSPLVADAVPAFRQVLEGVDVRAPRVPVYANATAAPHAADPEALRDLLASQLGVRVRFVEQIEAMYAAGARIFVEAGPGRVLTGLVRKVLGDRPHRVVAFEESGVPGELRLLEGVAALAAAGVPLHVDALFAGRELPEVALDKAPPASAASWIVDGQRARPAVGEPPPHALVPILEPIGAGAPPTAPADPSEHAVLSFLDNMRALADAQRDAMVAYLGGVPAAVRPVAQPAAPAPEIAAPAPAPAVHAPTPEAPADLLTTLVSIVSDLTGYPAEMLDPDADLEADLSIDSVKRIEVLSVLGDTLGAQGGALDDTAVETLATAKSLRAIVDWLDARDGAPTEPADGPAPAATAPVEAVVGRFRLVPTPAPLSTDPSPPGRVAVLAADAAQGRRIATALTDLGVDADVAQDDGPIDAEAIVHLDGAGPVAAFEPLRRALEAGARTVVGVDAGSPGLDGLFKTAAREYPDRTVRLVSLGADERAWADRVRSELGQRGGPSHVDWTDDARQAGVVTPAPLDRADGALPLTSDSVVLVTGGARGITAAIVHAMATEVPCTYVLVGRSALPGEEDPALADAPDAAALRARLIAGGGTPAEIERTVRGVLRDRELRDGLARLRATGATIDYRALDVRDRLAVRALIADLYAEHDRLDGVIHAAGVLDDKLMRDKSVESFARVYETKVHPAEVLLDSLRADTRFVVFFASISGVLGNRGQADYAAANATLDQLATALADRVSGRVVSIAWGPWEGAGMVSPELARAYARRGIPLMPLEQGVQAFLDELRHGSRDDRRVIWQAGHPDDFAEPGHA